MDINDLVKKAQHDEAKVIYEMQKALGKTGVNEYEHTIRGVSAVVTVVEKTITVQYADGTVSTYTEV
jgi:3-deoxy-D-arabino-heptulosonate 7-phosphate (DAHP) synthase class II